MICGQIRDIQPNQASPTLELHFNVQYRGILPQGNRANITLDLNGVRWHGTINSIGLNNPPYLHTRLNNDFKATSTCTQVFLALGLAEGAILEFACDPGAVLRLVSIINFGQWRAGNEPEKRRARCNSLPSQPSQSSTNQSKLRRTSPHRDIQEGDVERLIETLTRDFPVMQPSTDPAWSRPPALRVIDCVLSLNRSYDKFVVPRLDEFEREYPQIKSVHALRNLMDQHSTPADFVNRALKYNHPDRARILSEVIDFVLGTIGEIPLEAEISWLEQWAKSTSPDKHTEPNIQGFALAGFQYLRMLFGANTTKPDVHIRQYVAEAVGHGVSDLDALNLLEKAANQQGLVLRDVDTNIWELRARG